MRVPRRYDLGGEEEETTGRQRRLSEAEARQRLLVRVAFGVVALIVVVWLAVLMVGFVGRSREASRIYELLHRPGGAPAPSEADIQAFAELLAPDQLRVLVSGRSLDYTRLTAEQQDLFATIRPLMEPDAPAVAPYRVRLERMPSGAFTLRLIWQVPGTGEAVVQGLELE